VEDWELGRHYLEFAWVAAFIHEGWRCGNAGIGMIPWFMTLFDLCHWEVESAYSRSIDSGFSGLDFILLVIPRVHQLGIACDMPNDI
jgi:hypothetical protein